MNCSEFETCLLELVAEESHAGLAHIEARSHASTCSRCAARLAEERELVAGLRAWANRARLETAGAHVEDALLTRFRELGRAKETDPEIQSPKRALWKTPGYVGLAASVLLLVGWALMQFTRETGVEQAQHQPAPKPFPSSEEKSAAPLKVRPEPSAEPVKKPVRPVRPHRPQVSTPVTVSRIQHAAGASRRSESSLAAERTANDRVETEFIPFMAAGPQFPSEQRQFVRVKLPRSALQVFGLPMNMERAREPVQADVILGEDGRALAVRFVRE
jgi:hypothetical protein